MCLTVRVMVGLRRDELTGCWWSAADVYKRKTQHSFGSVFYHQALGTEQLVSTETQKSSQCKNATKCSSCNVHLRPPPEVSQLP